MNAFLTHFKNHEDWLAQKMIEYVKNNRLDRHISLESGVWQAGLNHFTKTIGDCIEKHGEDILRGNMDKSIILNNHLEYIRHHQAHGIEMVTFLRGLKLYRNCYLDLSNMIYSEIGLDSLCKMNQFLLMYFDELEECVLDVWEKTQNFQDMDELIELNKFLSDENAFYLMIYESLPIPSLILNSDNRLENLNFRALELLCDVSLLNTKYIRDDRSSLKESSIDPGDCIEQLKKIDLIKFFGLDLTDFNESTDVHKHFVSWAIQGNKKQKYSLEIMKVLDTTGKKTGFVITFTLLSELID